MGNIKRVYIAGPLTPRGNKNSNPAIEYLMNVRDLIRLGIRVMMFGFSPFIPALDIQIFLSLRPWENISEDQIKNYSVDWLEVCDAMLLTEDWKNSPGTVSEVEIAIFKNIPIFRSVEELIEGKPTKEF